MSANRRHRRSRVRSAEGLARRERGVRRETNRKWDAVTASCARRARMRAYRMPKPDRTWWMVQFPVVVSNY